MKEIKILGVLQNIPLVEKGVSGSRSLVYKHLRERGYVAGLIDAELSSFKQRQYLLKNYSFNKNGWMLKKNLDLSIRRNRSKVLNGKVESIDNNYNVVLQIGSEFSLHQINKLNNIPKFLYGDNNVRIYYESGFDSTNVKDKNKYRKMFEKAFNFEKEVYDNLDGIFCMTDYQRNSFVRDFNQPEGKVHTIGFGCNLEMNSIEDYNKDYSNRTILFVSKDSFQEKGGFLLLDAFKIVKDKYKDANLIVVGKKYNVDIPGIEWIGYIDKSQAGAENELKDIYKRSSLFVMPSFGEPAGNVFLEAMAFKLPCIGADQGATPAIILDNRCGLVVRRDYKEIAEKIITLFEDESNMKLYGNNGFNTIKTKYNWDVVCKKAIHVVSSYVK